MAKDNRQHRNRVPVVLYVCTSEPDTQELITEHLRTYAEARDWRLAGAFTDSDRSQDVDSRDGWQKTLGELARPEAIGGGIITYSSAMVAPSPPAFQELREQLISTGLFLVVAHTTATGPPGRTEQDSVRRGRLLTAAAGWPDS